jgi:hypothetical protein
MAVDAVAPDGALSAVTTEASSAPVPYDWTAAEG